MEIRACKKDYKRFKKYKTETPITLDENLSVSVIMIHVTNNSNGADKESKASLQEWTRGRKNIESFLKYGIVHIRKSCPYRHRKCIGEKCSLYVIQNSTGDCAHVWEVFKN